MRDILLIFITIFFIGCSSSNIEKPLYHEVSCIESVYSLKSGECLSEDDFIKRLEPYQVIFIGDHHNSKKLHKHIAKTITLLAEKGYRIHLANEWFTPQNNSLLDSYANKTIDDNEFVQKIEWNKTRKIGFDIFAPTYHAVIDSRGKLYGINMSKEQRKLISNADIDKMISDELSFYNSLDLNISAHKTLHAPFFSHCHQKKKDESDKECRQRMYRVQVAWDSKMAKETLLLAKDILKTPKDKLLVFAGASHVAYGLGINLHFARESNIPFVTIVPQSDNHNLIEHSKADFVYIYKKEKAAQDIEDKLIKDLKDKKR